MKHLNKFVSTAAILAGGMMFAGAAGAATTFFEDFEGASTQWTGSFGTYATDTNYSGDLHTTSVVDGGALYATLIGNTGASPDGGPIFATIDLSAADIIAAAAGDATYSFSGWLASWTGNAEASNFSVEFFDAAAGGGSSLGVVELANGKSITGSSDANTPSGTWNDKNWSLYEAGGSVATGTQSFVINYRSVTDAAGTQGGNDAYADNVSFTVVPEPSSVALLGLGGLALFLRRRR